jgi:hypothetical protein
LGAGVITKIDIWRLAGLMIKNHGKYAELESVRRADKLAMVGDENGAAVWRGVTRAVAELTNITPTGTLH